eukprot:scaffold15255_cov83-Phaeocystis_antarctica.AAC.1
MPRPRARGCGARPTRRCRIPTGTWHLASPITRPASRTACRSASMTKLARGTTSRVLQRRGTSARQPVLCRRPRRRRPESTFGARRSCA